VATRGNGQPAFACYLGDGGQARERPAGLAVLSLAGHHLAAITRFLEVPPDPDEHWLDDPRARMGF
jgi:RNA polymerase sigma-70 factor, ECF subfamily